MNIELSEKQVVFLIRALFCTFVEDQRERNSGTREALISSLISKLPDEYYDSIYEEADGDSRLDSIINKPLFLGSGIHSVVAKNKLYKRLEFAISQLSAIQQNGGMGTEFDEELDIKCKTDIVDVIRDFITAFGFEITPIGLIAEKKQ